MRGNGFVGVASGADAARCTGGAAREAGGAGAGAGDRDVMLCYRMHYSAGGESGNLRQYPLIRRIVDCAADNP